jgi:hypothetical protein
MLHGADMISFEECARALLSADYRFAKTMPQNPHWYTLRRTWNNDHLFDKVVEYMRANSYTECFCRKPYQMFDLNGYKYWTMGAEICETILINRRPK